MCAASAARSSLVHALQDRCTHPASPRRLVKKNEYQTKLEMTLIYLVGLQHFVSEQQSDNSFYTIMFKRDKDDTS